MSYSEVKGDLLSMARNGEFDIIVHGCNCFCTMGSGIARQVKSMFPEAYRADQCTKSGARKVGTFTWAHTTNALPFIIVNAYTQYSYGGGIDRFEYDGFRRILKQLRLFAPDDARIGFPQIGAGLGGGDWERIRSMIREELEGLNVTVVIYDQG